MPGATPATISVRVMMAVPQYPYPVTGGLERQSHELAKALLPLGVKVQAVSGKVLADQPSRETVEGIVVHRIPWPQRKLIRFLRTPFDLFTVLYTHRRTYDVIHLHQFSWFGAFVIVAARLLRKPVLTKLPSVGSTSLPGFSRSLPGALKLAIFKKTDSVVAMSGESLAELAAAGFPFQRVLRTPNGIRILSNEGAVTPHPAPPGPCRVVFVGRISPEKRVDDLLYAWQRVVATSTVPVLLELWGDGPTESDMKSLCATLGIADTVTFRGYVTSVREHLGAMDVFVLTSNQEGNSNAILEAMAAGLPVVSTGVGGTPMLVGSEGSHFLVRPGDREGLYARLMELIEHPALRIRVGREMRERIMAHFDINRVARTYATAYRLLADDRRNDMHTIGNPIVAMGNSSY